VNLPELVTRQREIGTVRTSGHVHQSTPRTHPPDHGAGFMTPRGLERRRPA
jgi:hypothetical protein